MGWGAAVTIAVHVSGFMGPAHLNPAVTLGLASAGLFSWGLVIPFILAQLVGAFVGAIIVWLAYLPQYAATKDEAAILGSFATGPAIRSYGVNVLTEAIGTFVLVFSLLAFTQNTFADGFNPVVVGILILSIGLSLGGPTGYAINPARDLGPRIAHQILPIKHKGDSDWAYSWVPIVGPFVGGVVAAILWLMLPI